LTTTDFLLLFYTASHRKYNSNKSHTHIEVGTYIGLDYLVGALTGYLSTDVVNVGHVIKQTVRFNLNYNL